MSSVTLSGRCNKVWFRTSDVEECLRELSIELELTPQKTSCQVPSLSAENLLSFVFWNIVIYLSVNKKVSTFRAVFQTVGPRVIFCLILNTPVDEITA